MMLTVAALLYAVGVSALLFVALGGNRDLARELHETRLERDARWNETVTLRAYLRDAELSESLWKHEALRLRTALPRDQYTALQFERVVRGLPAITTDGGAA